MSAGPRAPGSRIRSWTNLGVFVVAILLGAFVDIVIGGGTGILAGVFVFVIAAAILLYLTQRRSR